jgi:hypothetical protein
MTRHKLVANCYLLIAFLRRASQSFALFALIRGYSCFDLRSSA